MLSKKSLKQLVIWLEAFPSNEEELEHLIAYRFCLRDCKKAS
jgi:hypothetical protein